MSFSPHFLGEVKRETENPYKSDVAMEMLKQPEYENDPIVKLFANKIKTVENKKSEKVKRVNLSNSVMILQSDIESGIPLPPAKEISAQNIIRHYLGQESVEDIVQSYPIPIKPTQYLTFSLQSIKFGFDFIEPLRCVAFLYNGEKVISEYWTFIPNETIKLISPNSDIPFLKEVAFEFGEVSATVYLVILFQRILQIDSGSAVDKYYEKPSPKTKEPAKKSVIESYPRISDIYSTFAYTSARLTTIITNPHGFTFPNPSLCSHTIIRHLKEISQNRESKSQIPIQVTIKAGIKSSSNTSGFNIVYSTLPQAIEPKTWFRHQFIFRLNSISLKKVPEGKKARNIFAVISIQESQITPRLNYLIDPLTREHVKSLTSTCEYHERMPVFDDIFIGDLPHVLPPRLFIFIYLYHALVNADNENDRQFIGYAAIPIVNNGVLVKSGNISAGVAYGTEDKPDKTMNEISGEFIIKSTIFSSDNLIYNFLMNAKHGEFTENELDNIKPSHICRNLLAIMTTIVHSISIKPFESVRALIDMSYAVSQVYPTISQILAGYARYLFSRYDGVLQGYQEYIERIPDETPANQRKDFVAIPMLFQLATQNGVIEFTECFAPKVSAVADTGLIQAKKFIEEFAFFVRDNVPKEEAFVCIKKVSVHFYDTPNKAELLCSFLSIVFNSYLFDEIVLSTNQIPELCELAINLKYSRPIQGIFQTIINSVAKLDAQRQIFIANEMLPVINVLSPLSEVPFAEDNDLQPAITLFLWILSCAEEESIKRFINEQNEYKILRSLHFVLARLRNNIGTKRLSMLNKLEDKYAIKDRSKSLCFRSTKSKLSSNTTKSNAAAKNNTRDLLLCAQLISNRILKLASNYIEVNKLYFHMFTQDLSVHIIADLCHTYIELLANHRDQMKDDQSPPFKTLVRILELTTYVSVDFTPIMNINDIYAALAYAEIDRVNLVQPPKLKEIVDKIKLSHEKAYEAPVIDELGDALLELCSIYQSSVEGYYKGLQDLAEFWQIKDYNYEEIETRLAMVPLMKQMGNFEGIYELARYCLEKRLPEYTKCVLLGIDTLQADEIRASIDKVDVSTRLMSNFFRVTFTQNGVVRDYIYREKGATSIYALAQRMEADYQGSIVLKDSTLKPQNDGKLYINLQFVEPFFDDEIERSDFARHYDVSIFMFEQPFTLGNEKRGEINEQRLLRHILFTEHPLPYLTKRAKITEIRQQKLEPIEVCTNMIKERTKCFKKAMNSQDMMSIEQLLHGTLLVQVNAGPAAIAKEFFKGQDPLLPNLISIFKYFVDTVEQAKTMHKEWCDRESRNGELCVELESGFERLKDVMPQ